MYINCPNCSALVATDLATGLPPEKCSRCGHGPLREAASEITAFPPAPLAPPPAPAPGEPQAATGPIFIPLTPSRSTGPGGDARSPAPQPPPDPPPLASAPAATAAEAAPGTPEPEREPVAVADAGAVTTTAPPPDSPTRADPIPPPTPLPDAIAPAAGPADNAAAPLAEEVSSAAAARPAPRFLARRADAAAPADRRLVATAAGLALLLVVQLLVADRERLANIAAWRPLVVALCTPLPCSVPPWREPSAISVEQRDVRPAAGRAGVLSVNATIHNQARWAQAWPQLLLTFSDLDGRPLGMRAFEPAEYLAAPPAEVTIASGEQAAIAMEIVEPSPHAVAFNFDFR